MTEIIIEEGDRREEEVVKEEKDIDHLLRELLSEAREIHQGQKHTNHILRQILYRRAPQPYELELTLVSIPGGNTMSAGNVIALGGSAQLIVNLTQNGAVVTPQPAGLVPTVNSNSDPNVSSSPATLDATGGVTPLAQQFVLVDAATDTVGALDAVVVNMTAPDGTPLTATLNVTIGSAIVVNPNGFGIGLLLEPVPTAASAAAIKAARH